MNEMRASRHACHAWHYAWHAWITSRMSCIMPSSRSCHLCIIAKHISIYLVLVAIYEMATSTRYEMATSTRYEMATSTRYMEITRYMEMSPVHYCHACLHISRACCHLPISCISHYCHAYLYLVLVAIYSSHACWCTCFLFCCTSVTSVTEVSPIIAMYTSCLLPSTHLMLVDAPTHLVLVAHALLPCIMPSSRACCLFVTWADLWHGSLITYCRCCHMDWSLIIADLSHGCTRVRASSGDWQWPGLGFRV